MSSTETRPMGKVGGKAPKGGSSEIKPKAWFSKITLWVLVFVWTIPTIGLLVTSVRPRTAADTSGWWNALFNPFSAGWTLSNYDQVLNARGMGASFINSLVVAIPATIIPIMFAAFAAYAFTFMAFRGRDLLMIVVIALMVVPIQSTFVTLLDLFGPNGWDINGQFLAMWLLHTTFGMPLAIFILRNYMITLPFTVIESAKIDGASHYQTFWKLVVPMSIPALAAFAIFQFLWVWNDLLVALLFLGFDDPTVTVTLSQLNGRLSEGWQLLTAGAFITMTVPMLVFFGLQRFFVRGLTSGAVKG